MEFSDRHAEREATNESAAVLQEDGSEQCNHPYILRYTMHKANSRR